MNAMKGYSIFYIILITAFFTLHAQGAVKIRLLAFSRVGNATQVLVAGSDGKPFDKEVLELPTQQLSKSRVVASQDLMFLDAGAKTDAQSPNALMATVKLPAADGEFILVFLPNKAGSATPYQVQALPMPSEHFGSGAQAFVNYCDTDLGFIIDKERLEVHKGKVGVFRPKKMDGNHTIEGFEKGRDGKWITTPFYSSRLIIQEGVRSLILIVRNPQTGLPDFRGITDFVN